MADLSADEAASRLGVSPREVRRLLAAGTLAGHQVAGRHVVDQEALETRLGSRPARGRPFTARIAWAALWELAGMPAGWLSDSERSRLRSRLRHTDPDRLALACRHRAVLTAVRCLPRYLPDVAGAGLTATGGVSAAAAAGADILGDNRVELYCSTAAATELKTRFGLLASRQPNVLLRVPRFSAPELLDRPVMPAPVVAVDLLESHDVRSRRAGRHLLEAALARLA